MTTSGISWDMTELTHRVATRRAALVKKDPQAVKKGPEEGWVWLKDIQPAFKKFNGLWWSTREAVWAVDELSLGASKPLSKLTSAVYDQLWYPMFKDHAPLKEIEAFNEPRFIDPVHEIAHPAANIEKWVVAMQAWVMATTTVVNKAANQAKKLV
jgi:hypothetical protein